MSSPKFELVQPQADYTIKTGIAILCLKAFQANRHFRVRRLNVSCDNCGGKGYWMHGSDEIPCEQTVHQTQDNVDRMVLLTVGELLEGYEGWRKSEQDHHLPNRLAFEVELADAVIRIADLAASLNMDLGGAIIEKMEYNKNRPDHKISARTGRPGAKRF